MRCPGIQKDIGRATKQPGERDLHRRGAEPLRHIGQRRRLQRREAAEREEWHIGDANPGKVVDHRIVAPMREIVLVLHTDDLADPTRFGDLRRGDIAQPDVTYQTPLLEFGQHGQRRLDRSFCRAVLVEHGAKVDHLQHVEPEIARIVVHCLGQLVGGEGREP